MNEIRHDWTKEEIESIYHSPLLELVYRSASVHRRFHNPQEVQLCTLLSIKTGGCPENCAYCPQSSHYETGVKAEPLMNIEDVIESAKQAKAMGSTRFCMGAAWRQVRDNAQFDRVLEMIKGVDALGMEVCVTLGMLTEAQAERLKEAGLYAYNHNLDTSNEYYPTIISTRTYQDRLDTLETVRNAGISVCCGGIVGLGESESDRVSFLHTLSTLSMHPESVPINKLIAVKGTPLENQKAIPIWEMVRTIATARILMPLAMIRLSAGRMEMNEVEQGFCFLAGANSIHTGERLLVTEIPGYDEDAEMFARLGLISMSSKKFPSCGNTCDKVKTA